MNSLLGRVGGISAVLSSAFCLAAGAWILGTVGFQTNDDGVWTAMGLYFIGKALFVGPTLLILAVKGTQAGR